MKKCSFYILRWVQDRFGCMQMSNEESEAIQTNIGSKYQPELVPIQFKTNNTPNKYIGITTSPNGECIHPLKSIKKNVLNLYIP